MVNSQSFNYNNCSKMKQSVCHKKEKLDYHKFIKLFIFLIYLMKFCNFQYHNFKIKKIAFGFI